MHIPKTGGETMGALFAVRKDHRTAIQRLSVHHLGGPDAYVVSVVRNPWSRALGWFRFCIAGYHGEAVPMSFPSGQKGHCTLARQLLKLNLNESSPRVAFEQWALNVYANPHYEITWVTLPQVLYLSHPYGTVEVPAAPKKKSLKRLVAAAAAVTLALGFCAVKAADHAGIMAFKGEPVEQIKINGNPEWCLGVKDQAHSMKKSRIVLTKCSAGQEFQVDSHGLKHKVSGGRNICVRARSMNEGDTYEIYACKGSDVERITHESDKTLQLGTKGLCMTPSSLSDDAPIVSKPCGDPNLRLWDLGGDGPGPTLHPRPTPQPTRRPPRPSDSQCGKKCKGDMESADCTAAPTCAARATSLNTPRAMGRASRSCRRAQLIIRAPRGTRRAPATATVRF